MFEERAPSNRGLIRANVVETDNGSGGDRTRTDDFYDANVALYQLSYTPEGLGNLPPTIA